MILIFKTLIANTLKANDAVNQVAAKPEMIDQITKLLEVIVWPLIVIVFVLSYKKDFTRLLSRVGSFKLGPQGAEVTLLEKSFKEAIDLGLSTETPLLLSKDGGGIIPKDGGGIIPKDGKGTTPQPDKTNIVYQTSHAATPQMELLELQEAINHKLKTIATQNNLTHTGSTNFALTIGLENEKIISNKIALQLKKLIELTNIGANTSQLTYDQVIQMKKMFINISF